MIKIEDISSDGSNIYISVYEVDYDSFEEYLERDVQSNEVDGNFDEENKTYEYSHVEGCCLIRQID